MAINLRARDRGMQVNHKMSLDVESMSFMADSVAVQRSVNMTAADDRSATRSRRCKRKNRRLKTELEIAEKQFKCGCGKNYLSYAALYTHTKVKHNGLFPEGTYAGEKRKQGRPKVSRFDPETNELVDYEGRQLAEEARRVL